MISKQSDCTELVFESVEFGVCCKLVSKETRWKPGADPDVASLICNMRAGPAGKKRSAQRRKARDSKLNVRTCEQDGHLNQDGYGRQKEFVLGPMPTMCSSMRMQDQRGSCWNQKTAPESEVIGLRDAALLTTVSLTLAVFSHFSTP